MDILQWPIDGFEDCSLEPGKVTVIAAPRQTGKSTFAADLAAEWSRECNVLLGVLHPAAIPERYRGEPPFRTYHMGCSIDRFAIDVVNLSPDVLILDEVYFSPFRENAPSSRFHSIPELAAFACIPVVCIISRSPLVDVIFSADAKRLRNDMPVIRKGGVPGDCIR